MERSINRAKWKRINYVWCCPWYRTIESWINENCWREVSLLFDKLKDFISIGRRTNVISWRAHLLYTWDGMWDHGLHILCTYFTRAWMKFNRTNSCEHNILWTFDMNACIELRCSSNCRLVWSFVWLSGICGGCLSTCGEHACVFLNISTTFTIQDKCY